MQLWIPFENYGTNIIFTIINCDPKNKIVEVTICVHMKHNGHELEFESDKYFLPMQPLVIVVFFNIDTLKNVITILLKSNY